MENAKGQVRPSFSFTPPLIIIICSPWSLQAEAFARLETEVSQARKQDRASQDALVLLQTELDQAEKDVARLKASAPTPDAPAEGAGGGAAAGGDPYGGDGSLETHQLLQQVRSSC